MKWIALAATIAGEVLQLATHQETVQQFAADVLRAVADCISDPATKAMVLDHARKQDAIAAVK